jgi:hypothetical protein
MERQNKIAPKCELTKIEKQENARENEGIYKKTSEEDFS